MHPLSVRIITRDTQLQKEIHQQYDLQTRFPRLGLLKIFLRALMSLRYR
jgi:hypothetical protein